MKTVPLLFGALILTAQTQTFTYDYDGRRVPLPSAQESRKTLVREDTAGGRVLEELVQRRDASGNPLPAEKVRSITRQGADGAQVTETVIYRADINGRMEPRERTIATTQGDTSTVQYERPNINGGFEIVEKAASRTAKEDGKTIVNTSIYRVGNDGRLVEAARQVTERKPEGTGTREVISEYQNASTGKMELSQQKVTVSLANPDGSSTSEITIYGQAAPGRPMDGTLKIREQQLITAKPGPGNTIQETLSVRRPDLADPEKLGAYRKVAEKISEAPRP
jgi:hypothetical protein